MSTTAWRTEVGPHGIVIRDPIPIDALSSIQVLADSMGFDLMDAGVASAIGAVMVITNAEGSRVLRDEAERAAKDKSNGDALTEWLHGTDTGVSSKTIASVLSGRPELASPHFGRDVPHDPDDLGRCIRLLDRMPGWRERLHEVAAELPKWAPLVEHWDELEALYRDEEPIGIAPLCYARMKELLGS